MINFTKNKKIPNELFEKIKHNGSSDYAVALTSTPINIVIAFNKITKKEVDILINGAFEIGASIIDDVPFLTFMFKGGLSFDTIVYSMESKDESQNAMNLIVVDSSDYTFKTGRMLGIDKELLKVIIDGVKNITYSKEMESMKQKMIYNMYSTEDIHNNSIVKQQFGVH